MKYYLVALFDSESYKTLSPVQRNLSKRYKAIRNSPIPYIPLEVIENPNVDRLDIVIEKLIKPYKTFKVELCNEVNLCENSKTLNVKVEDVGYIKRLNRIFNDGLKLHGFNVKNINTEDSMHISLANLNFIPKDSKTASIDSNFDNKVSTLKISRLELWKFSNNKRETLIKTYPLKQP